MAHIISISLPEELIAQAQQLVHEGLYPDFDSLLAEALGRYLDSHNPTVTEGFIRKDIAWGLHGVD
jgi:Arc/MetJ-type ribon-helix-helix transcriptional regulator